MSNIRLLNVPKLGDTPELLRNIAQAIEEGEYGTITAGVVILEDSKGSLSLFGAGAAESHRALSIITGAQITMSQKLFGVNDPT